MTLATPDVLGRVEGIDRANRVLRAVLDTGETIEDVTYDARRRFAPWPWCLAWFRGGPPWRCLGPVGRRERIFRDHFTRVASATGYGDTFWNILRNSVGMTFAPVTGVGLGVLRITQTIVEDDGWIHKDADAFVVPTFPQALHLVARLKTTTFGCGIMFADTDPNFATILAAVDDSGPYVSVSNGGSSATETYASEEIGNTMGWLELLVTGGLVAGWTNGSGPAYIQSNACPDAGAALTPYIGTAVTSVGIGDPSSDYVDIDAAALDLVTIGSL